MQKIIDIADVASDKVVWVHEDEAIEPGNVAVCLQTTAQVCMWSLSRVDAEKLNKNLTLYLKMVPAKIVLDETKLGNTNLNTGLSFNFVCWDQKEKEWDHITQRDNDILIAVTKKQFKEWSAKKIMVFKNEKSL